MPPNTATVTFNDLAHNGTARVHVLYLCGDTAPNQVIARSELEFIRSECDEGCDWCIYVTVVTCADTLTFTLCIQ